MFCKKCGTQDETGSKFCNSCGETINEQPQDHVVRTGTAPSHLSKKSVKEANKKIISIFTYIAIGLIIGIGAIILITSVFNRADQPLTVREMLDLGEKYLRELEYEQALEQFIKVIDIEPRNPRGYTGAAESYIGLGRVQDAIDILERGLVVIGNNSSISYMLDEVREREEPYNIENPTIITPGNPTIEPPDVPGLPPLDEDSGVYAAYYNLLGDLVAQYGLSDNSFDGDGIWRVALIDFDNDGVDELFVLRMETYYGYGAGLEVPGGVVDYAIYGYDKTLDMATLLTADRGYRVAGAGVFILSIFSGQDGGVYIRTRGYDPEELWGIYKTFVDGELITVLTSVYVEPLWDWDDDSRHIGYILDGVEVDDITALSTLAVYESELLFVFDDFFPEHEREWNFIAENSRNNNFNEVLQTLAAYVNR